MIIIDFLGFIVGIATNFPGVLQDRTICRCYKYIYDTIHPYLAIGDPGFTVVDFVVPGYQRSQLNSGNTERRIKFDKITRSEQVLIEQVNQWYKKECVNKEGKKRHKPQLLALFNVICAGLYNWKKLYGDNKLDSSEDEIKENNEDTIDEDVEVSFNFRNEDRRIEDDEIDENKIDEEMIEENNEEPIRKKRKLNTD